MAAIQKNHQDAVAISELAHRSMDALDHEFVIELELHDLVKGKLSLFLLPPHVLKSSIHQVQNIITEKFQHF